MAPDLDALRHLARILGEMTDATAAIDATLDTLAGAGGCDAAALHLREGPALRLAGVRGRGASSPSWPGDGAPTQAASTGMLARARWPGGPSPVGASGEEAARVDVASAPVRDGAAILGALSLARAGVRLDEADIALLETLAALLGLALGAARRREGLARVEGRLAEDARVSAVGRLVPGIAHEMNNPLTAISGQVQLLLLRRDLPEPLRDRLQIVADQTTRVARLLRTLLVFSRGQAAARRACALADQVQRVLDLTGHHLHQEGVRVVSQLGPAPLVHAEEGALQHAILALVQRAQRAMASVEGERTLTLRLAESAGAARLEVLDTGPAPTAEALVSLFDAFGPAPDGPALAVAHRIVAAHGGRLTAAPGPGGGAILTLELPAGDPAPAG